MKTLWKMGVWGIALAFVPLMVTISACARSGGEVEELLNLHKELIEAHKNNDVRRLLVAEPEEIVQVSRGEVLFPVKTERTRQFERYLISTEFEEYRDLIDPIVRVSKDGTLGWLIAQVRIVGTQTTGNGERIRIDSVWAWIELYEKRDDRWYRVGEVSNVQPVNL